MMRILFSFILVFVFLAGNVNAQRKHTEAFEKGIVLADFHSSIGLYKNRNFVTQRMPIFAGVDYGITNDLSGGAFAGWNQRTFKDAKFPAYDVNYYYFGGRFSVHLTEFLARKTILKFNPKTVDIYGTFWAGRQVASQVTFSGSSFLDSGKVTIYGAYAGVRMYSMYRIGVLLEFGLGPYGLLNVGICTKI